jgi:hypothetical protein
MPLALATAQKEVFDRFVRNGDRDMPDIKHSVGADAHNDEADVIIVQRLLNATPLIDGGANPILDIDGWCGPTTINAISRFQRIQLGGISDGTVEPRHRTIDLLNATATQSGARRVPDPDPDPATQARLDAPKASIWGQAGLAAVEGLIKHVGQTGRVGGFDPIVETALAAHFHITGATPRADATRLLAIVRTNFIADLVEISSGVNFHSVSRRQMHIDFAGSVVKENPGYTIQTPRRRMFWSALFHPLRGSKPGYDWAGPGFGPLCRAAMVLHEPIHFVDSQANFDTYEWGPEYVALPADRAAHNASSYPSFAAHVAERSSLPLGPRYGAGRPTQ